jgi:hypothetical protein
MLEKNQRFGFALPQIAVLGSCSGYFYVPTELFSSQYIEGLSPRHKVRISPEDVFVVMATERSNNGWTVRFRMETSHRPFILYQREEGKDALADNGRFIKDSDIVPVGRCVELVF